MPRHRGSRNGPRECHTLGPREQSSPSHPPAAAHAAEAPGPLVRAAGRARLRAAAARVERA